VIGRTVSHYEILEEIGGGGMGVVYKARDTRLDRLVALKFLPAEWRRDAVARERFVREARAASAIDHPHIGTVHDIGETEDGRMYIAMAYYPGQTLTRRIGSGPLPIETALAIAAQAAEALAAAHDAGIVHRDIKPANILLDSRHQVKLVDFGLAKLGGGGGVTRTGLAVGTPAYMSPEQAEGRPLDHRTDLWSLGAVLYEMLAGLRAFSGDSDHAVMYSVIHGRPTPLAELRPDLPGEIVAIVDRCLAKDPERRYPNASELLRDLRRARGDSPSGDPTIAIPPGGGPRRRGLAWAAAAGATALVAITAAGLWRLAVDHAPPLPADKTLVVLPFTPTDPSPAALALCDGLLEQVTRTLGGMRRFHDSLTVIPAPVVRSERVTDANGALVAFGANLAVSGSVESDGGGVLRILLELVDTRAGRAIRRRTVPWAVGQGTTLQAALTDALAEMLELELDEPTRTAVATGGTRDREAQALYMQAAGELAPESSVEALDRAIGMLRQALEYDPSFALARVGLAEACRRRADLTGEPTWARAALIYARAAADDAPRLPSAQLVLGRVLVDAGATAEGLEKIDLAIELDPLNVEALRARALVLVEVGDRGAARASFDEAITIRPDDWLTVLAAGSFFYDGLDLETAVGYYRRLTELRPAAATAWSNLGAALFRGGDPAGARAALERSLAIGPTYEALSNLATLEFYEARFAEAVTGYEQALAIDDRDFMVWNNLAESLRFSGAPSDRVAAAYRRAGELAEPALARAPDDHALRLVVATASAAGGDRARARELADQVHAAGVDDPVLCFILAAVEEDLGERGRALELLDRAVGGGFPAAEVMAYPGFEALRRDPGFQTLARRWAATRPPADHEPGSSKEDAS
jgi:serine/threonine-protein kinase